MDAQVSLCERAVVYIPEVIKGDKLLLLERIGKSIDNRIARTVGELERLPDEAVPIICCLGELAPLVRKWQTTKRDFIFWDRGYMRRTMATWLPRGADGGYYRCTLNAFQMQEIYDVPDDRWKTLDIENQVRPWNKNGRHILLAHTGFDYWDLFADRAWSFRIAEELKKHTDRPIRLRGKESTTPLWDDLKDAHALVTHGSIAAVEAVVMGCPVFVHPFSTARLVGLTDFSQVEKPVYPSRSTWLHSLAYCQYNEAELVDGTLFRLLR